MMPKMAFPRPAGRALPAVVVPLPAVIGLRCVRRPTRREIEKR